MKEDHDYTRPLRVDVLTLFPAICEGALSESIVKRARAAGKVQIAVHNIRDHAVGKHQVTDDRPYGGGPGMVMIPSPIFSAVEALVAEKRAEAKVILLTPQGKVFNQETAVRYSKEQHLVLVCGHYEGIDHRVAEHLVDEELSIGDFILSNGAIAANVVIDAIVRLVPGVLGCENSPEEESFSHGLLEAPQYTRPADFRGWKVPDVLLSGHHAEIAEWRSQQALERTRRNRPDILLPENHSNA